MAVSQFNCLCTVGSLVHCQNSKWRRQTGWNGSSPIVRCREFGGLAARIPRFSFIKPQKLRSYSPRVCKAGEVSVPEPAPERNSSAGEGDSRQTFFSNWKMNAGELRAKAAKWGLAAVLAYGLFDGITYTTFFVLAFLGYEKSTGQNPAANLKALLGVVVLMWGGNNVTRPFRVAGAAALAPALDRGLKKMQEALKLPIQAFAFMICVAAFASLCFSVVGLLILSRWGR